MKVYLHDLKRWSDYGDYIYGIVYMDKTYVEYGYFQLSLECVPIDLLRNYGDFCYAMNNSVIKVPIEWCDKKAAYVVKGKGRKGVYSRRFNYPLKRKYNLCKLAIRQRFEVNEHDVYLDHLSQFTFGFEHETSDGNIPWFDCLNFDLIPLYDGSISGHEYVSLPLTFTNVIPTLTKHLSLLKNHTIFNHNCSLHIHFGNFPIEKDTIVRLTKYWSTFQYDLLQYLPPWSYQVELYKDNHKAYNQPLNIRNFDDWFEATTGNIYGNEESFYLPNLHDADENAKWNVKGRYFNLNIMHLISGASHKTVEFRFLRPTHNVFELKWYLIVLGAFLRFVIEHPDQRGTITVEKVITAIFPKKLAVNLLAAGKVLRHLSKFQQNIEDLGGLRDKLKQAYLKHFKFEL